MCIKSMRMIILHNTVLTAGVNEACAPNPDPVRGSSRTPGHQEVGVGVGGAGHSGSRCANKHLAH